MTVPPTLSPSEKRKARAAARRAQHAMRRAIREAALAGWAGEDADESNWLDKAAHAHPDTDAAVLVLYGLAMRLVDRVAETTGEDRKQVLEAVLR